MRMPMKTITRVGKWAIKAWHEWVRANSPEDLREENISALVKSMLMAHFRYEPSLMRRMYCSGYYAGFEAGLRMGSADSDALRTVIPTHCGQRSGDCGQFLMSV
jgi:hypothetical protein